MSYYAIFEDVAKSAFRRMSQIFLNSDQLNVELNKGIKITPQTGLSSTEAGLIINADSADFAQIITGRIKMLDNAGSGKLYMVFTDEGEITWDIHTIIKPKSADQNITLTTFANDAHLAFSIGANETWQLDSQIFLHNNDSGIKDLHYQLTLPTGAIVKGNGTWGYNANTAARIFPDYDGNATPTNDLDRDRTLQSVNNGTNVYAILHIKGLIVNGSTAGTVQLQWRKDAGATTGFTVMANSYIKATKIL